MTQKNRKPTKATQVQESIRDDIVCGRIRPGEKLQMDELKDRYKMGYSPLREALSRLISCGLVKQEEQCGFCVAPLSLDELYDLYHVRSYIESLALELAMQNGDDKWEADILSAWHVFAKFLDPKSKQKIVQSEWDQLQKEFLYALVKGCHSPWLLKIFDMLYDQASRYRGICIQNHSKDKKRMYHYIKENQNLVDAVLARNIKKALKISHRNWQYSIKSIAEMLEKNLRNNNQS